MSNVPPEGSDVPPDGGVELSKGGAPFADQRELEQGMRVREVLNPNLSTVPVVDEFWIAGPGLMVECSEGSRVWAVGDPEPFLDLIGAYSSTNFGHRHAEILRCHEEATRRADNVIAFNCPERMVLTEKLVRHLHGGGKGYQVRYTVGGARAVEDACKLAMLHTGRQRIVSLTGAFHGCSLATIGLTDPKFTGGRYRGLVHDPLTVAFPDVHDTGSHEKSLHELRSLLTGRQDIAAVIAEPVQGAAGFRMADPRFFQGLREITRERGVLLIMDEVQVGLGRTGDFYAHERFSIDADIVLIGKSLAGGYWPLSALIARQECFESAGPGRSGFESTFDNNVYALCLANGVVEYLEESHLLDHVREVAPTFEQHMRALQTRHPSIIRRLNVIGLACGWQTPSVDMANTIKERALEHHLIVQPAGIEGNYIKISPALTITKVDLEVAMECLEKALEGL